MLKGPFKPIPQDQSEKMVIDIKRVVDKYYPDSAANGVAGLLYAFDVILHANILEGVFSPNFRDIFAEQIGDSFLRTEEEHEDAKRRN
jgi:hypothetical protein